MAPDGRGRKGKRAVGRLESGKVFEKPDAADAVTEFQDRFKNGPSVHPAFDRRSGWMARALLPDDM
jgi:hypothetical protein